MAVGPGPASAPLATGLVRIHAGCSSTFAHWRARAGPGAPPTSATRRCSVLEQQRRELVQAPPPGEPLVRGAGGLVVHVLDAQAVQGRLVAPGALDVLRRADADEEGLELLVEASR